MIPLLQLLRTQVDLLSPDLHFHIGVPPLFRDARGNLVKMKDFQSTTSQDISEIVSQLLTEEEISLFEKQKDFEIAKEYDGIGRFRIHFSYSLDGQSINFRYLIGSDTIPSFEELRIPEKFKESAMFHRGLVLITGPNGSGKTTTLSSLIELINTTRHANIVTIERPIEIIFTGKKSIISQREIGEQVPSLKAAAKHLFRQDVNVVVFGEINTFEDFSAAITIAETGHLVISTMHAEDVVKTLHRMIYSFPAEQQNQIRIQVALALRMILSQKLLPAVGRRRVLATELLYNSYAIRSIILSNKEHLIKSTLETNKKEGMFTFDQSIRILYEENIISYETALLFSENKKAYTGGIEM